MCRVQHFFRSKCNEILLSYWAHTMAYRMEDPPFQRSRSHWLKNWPLIYANICLGTRNYFASNELRITKHNVWHSQHTACKSEGGWGIFTMRLTTIVSVCYSVKVRKRTKSRELECVCLFVIRAPYTYFHIWLEHQSHICSDINTCPSC